MDDAVKLAQPGEPLLFGLTGGEAFVDIARLVDVVRHGAGLGATVTCVTNGFWASSAERARKIVDRVQTAGLTHLAVSTSRYHQQFVGIDRVRCALNAAREAGMQTQLKVAYFKSDARGGALREWINFIGEDNVAVFPYVPYLRSGVSYCGRRV